MTTIVVLTANSCGSRVDVRPALATASVAGDIDDPAIWVHPEDPSRSLIFGTNKIETPRGALVVFDLAGQVLHTIDGIDRPNNVDVEYGLELQGEGVDVVIVTERWPGRLRVFRIGSEGTELTDISSEDGLRVFEGQGKDQASPMGIALYRRPRDGAIFAIVSRKAGPAAGYLWQYRLEDDGAGRVKATKVREFGHFYGGDEIEAVAVDDALGYVYYSEEGRGIHKWHADPEHPDAARELALFGEDGFSGDREGIAIYSHSDGTGYVICAEQLDGNSEYHFFRREGTPDKPHNHSETIKVVRGGADATDGIEATSLGLGPQFPHGLLVVMNSDRRNFLVYRWEDLAATGEPKLTVGAPQPIRHVGAHFPKIQALSFVSRADSH